MIIVDETRQEHAHIIPSDKDSGFQQFQRQAEFAFIQSLGMVAYELTQVHSVARDLLLKADIQPESLAEHPKDGVEQFAKVANTYLDWGIYIPESDVAMIRFHQTMTMMQMVVRNSKWISVQTEEMIGA